MNISKRTIIIALVVLFIVVGTIYAMLTLQSEGILTTTEPTPTPIPTVVATKPLSPTPTPTIQQRIGGMLNGDSNIETYTFNTGGSHPGPTTTVVLYDTKAQKVSVTADVAYHNDTDSIKLVTYDIMKDIYTSNIHPIKSVDVQLLGMVQDKYGKQSSPTIATATLNTDMASKFVWDNLDENSAWSDYDTTWLLYNS